MSQLDRWATWDEVQAQPATRRVWSDAFDVAAAHAWAAALGQRDVLFCGTGT